METCLNQLDAAALRIGTAFNRYERRINHDLGIPFTRDPVLFTRVLQRRRDAGDELADAILEVQQNLVNAQELRRVILNLLESGSQLSVQERIAIEFRVVLLQASAEYIHLRIA